MQYPLGSCRTLARRPWSFRPDAPGPGRRWNAKWVDTGALYGYKTLKPFPVAALRVFNFPIYLVLCR